VSRWLTLSLGTGLAALGVGGLWLGLATLSSYAPVLLALGLVVLGSAALQSTFYRAGTGWPATTDQPRRLELGWTDVVKAALCWAYGFKRSYVVEPGLYHLGPRYDRKAPLLVTANYHLTVFLIARRARRHGARLLVIDTDGINVWCAAGKGRFSNARIQEQLDRYDRSLLTDGKWLPLILPKFGFSGVDLRRLRDERIRPIVGPLYAKHLDSYLANPPYRDRDADRVVFGLQMRLFSWLPGWFQFVFYGLAIAGLWIAVERPVDPTGPAAVVGLSAFLGTAYPVLFPWLPGTRFGVKGLWLGAFTSLGLGALTAAQLMGHGQLIAASLYALAMALFVGLSYTGNSAVSNYTLVRQEIARFLPLNLVLFLAALAALIATKTLS
jgi:hypothetical protein